MIYLMSFIGIAINIWKNEYGTGGITPPGNSIEDRFNEPIVDRFNDFIVSR